MATQKPLYLHSRRCNNLDASTKLTTFRKRSITIKIVTIITLEIPGHHISRKKEKLHGGKQHLKQDKPETWKQFIFIPDDVINWTTVHLVIYIYEMVSYFKNIYCTVISLRDTWMISLGKKDNASHASYIKHNKPFNKE